MRKRVVHTDLAESDLTEHIDSLAEENPEVAFRFIQAVEKAVARLAEMPEIGALREFRNPRLAGVRLWPIPSFQKYLLFYQVTPEIRILRVLHGARDIPALFDEES